MSNQQPTRRVAAAGSGVGRATGFELMSRDQSSAAIIDTTVLPDGPLFEVAGIHHTQCGTGGLADDTFRGRYAERIGAEETAVQEHAVLDPVATVTRDVERLRSAPPSPPASPCPATSTTSSAA